MSIDVFQISTAILAASTVGLAVVAHGLHARLKGSRFILENAREHVTSLKNSLHLSFNREETLTRQNEELNAMVTRTQNQRLAALSKAAANRAAKSGKTLIDEAAARDRTIAEMQSTRFRPRDEVVANIRASKAAQQVSSAD